MKKVGYGSPVYIMDCLEASVLIDGREVWDNMLAYYELIRTMYGG